MTASPLESSAVGEYSLRSLKNEAAAIDAGAQREDRAVSDKPRSAPPGAADWAQSLTTYVEQGQRIFQTFLERQSRDGFTVPDPGVVGRVFQQLGAAMMADPAKLATRQMELWRDHMALWSSMAEKAQGKEVDPVATPASGDRRFEDEEWQKEVGFDYMKQSYLLTSRWLQGLVNEAEGLDAKTALKARFYTRQFVDAMAPTNFVLGNPKVLRATMESGGENLMKGFGHLLGDLEKGEGQLRISMTDDEAFDIGENIVVTPGKVIYQNDLMQLIQYTPTTETAHKRPLLVVPAWINKYYILDLRPKNSFIKWAVDQGHTVFIISWVNPDETLSHKRFDDYVTDGVLAAAEVIETVTGEPESNVIGYCIGGTLVACTLAYLAARGERRFASATYFTSMVDFEDPGELGVFIDEEQIALMEEHMKKTGYLEGRHMSIVFNLMRANDLIWSFVVNNYLLGNQPFPFDLLYWNADSTRMPAAMHSFYVRNMYLENNLIKPGRIELHGVPIDLGRIDTPSYILSTREDHIAPWKSTYAATQVYAGPKKFVLAGSGHIAGVINPASSNKYGYWTNPKFPADRDAWLAAAKENEGSWWPDWEKWVGKHAGGQVPAREPGGGVLEPIEDAPGSYVKVRHIA